MKQHDENERTAMFAGTFDPFTMGHHSIVQRVLPLFDKVVIAVGNNVGKTTMFSLDERVGRISNLYRNEPRIDVVAYDGLTIDYARKIGAGCLVRGVRSVKDFEYERDLADLNRSIGGVETLLLISEPRYAALSSSAVRELLVFGKDVSEFLP